MTLHPVLNDTRGPVYCGPAAIAIITGHPISRVKQGIWERRIREGRPKTIRGMWISELRSYLRGAGFRSVYQPCSRDDGSMMTLAAWLRQRDPVTGLYLVNVTGHFVVVQGRKIADNLHPTPVWLRRFKGRRKRVLQVYRVVPDRC